MRKVTEQDFRKDEFKNSNPEHYEFRHDGRIVRKDRFEDGIQSLKVRLKWPRNKEWEIFDLLHYVDVLMVIRDEFHDNSFKSHHFTDWS
jgi:hypothetical protein